MYSSSGIYFDGVITQPTCVCWPADFSVTYFCDQAHIRPSEIHLTIAWNFSGGPHILQNGLKKGILCKINFRTVAQFVFYIYSFNKSEYKLLKNFPVDFLESLTYCAAATVWVDLLVNDALIEPCSPCIIYMEKNGYIRLFIKDEKVGQHREGIIYEVIFPFYKQFMFHSCTSY